MTTTRVADGLFEVEHDAVTLIVARCRDCGVTVFPVQTACPRCTTDRMEAESLGGPGILWSYTVQRFRPKEPYDGPVDFEPYGVGYVLFGDRVIIEGRLTDIGSAKLRIGQQMDIVTEVYTTRDDGSAVMTYAFRPVD